MAAAAIAELRHYRDADNNNEYNTDRDDDKDAVDDPTGLRCDYKMT